MNKDPGYVYILTNPSFKEDWVKIGKSSRPVDIRSKELDNTAVPLPFEIYATMKTVKYAEAEKLVHRYIERFTNLRIRDNREFFNVSPEAALEIFRDVAVVLDDAIIDEVHKNSIIGDAKSGSKGHHTTPPRKEKKVWMIPSNSKYFDLEGCFEKYGEVYWSQYYNFQKGDTAYIYSASPNSAILYKVEVVAHDLTFSSDIEKEREFHTNLNDFEDVRRHNRYAKLKFIARTNSTRLSFAYLLEHGLNGVLRGSLNLSHPAYAGLLKYIEKNF